MDFEHLCRVFADFSPADVIDESLRREIDILKRLSHPNIVELIESYWVDETLYIFMEFVQGKSLRRAIPPGGMGEGEAKAIFFQLASAVAYCHANQVRGRGREGRTEPLIFVTLGDPWGFEDGQRPHQGA